MELRLRISYLKEYERYLIFENGLIFDVKQNKYINDQLNKDGYRTITLRNRNGKRKTFRVHRLVGLAFIPNPDNLPEINHKDGIKLNCDYQNLEWCTHSYNMQHAWDTKLLKNTKKRSDKLSKAHKGKHKGKENSKARKIICLTTNEIFDSMIDAVQKYKLSQSSLVKCCKTKSEGYGYKSCGKHPLTNQPLKWSYYENRY